MSKLPVPTLARMKGDAEASIEQWFGVYAEGLPPKLSTTVVAAGNAIIEATLKTKMGEFFKLTEKRAGEIIEPVGAQAAWLPTIADAAGFKFLQMRLPPLPEFDEGGGRVNAKNKTQRSQHQDPTVSRLLSEAGNLFNVVVPNECFRFIKTADPLNQCVSTPEIEDTVEAVVIWVAAKWARTNLGTGLCQHLAFQLHRRMPNLPVYGNVDTSSPKYFTRALCNK